MEKQASLLETVSALLSAPLLGAPDVQAATVRGPHGGCMHRSQFERSWHRSPSPSHQVLVGERGHVTSTFSG